MKKDILRFIMDIPSKYQKSESDDFIKNSNPSIKISDNEDMENKAKDAFIEISDKYETFWETYTLEYIGTKKVFRRSYRCC